jgi:hypothetical protein
VGSVMCIRVRLSTFRVRAARHRRAAGEAPWEVIGIKHE